MAPNRLGAKVAVVYEAGPRLAQCEPPALTPAQSAAKLTAAGFGSVDDIGGWERARCAD